MGGIRCSREAFFLPIDQFINKKTDARGIPANPKSKLLYYVVVKIMGNPPAKSSEKWADAEEGFFKRGIDKFNN